MINEWRVLYEPGLMKQIKQKFEINIINFLQETKEKQEFAIIEETIGNAGYDKYYSRDQVLKR